MAESYYDILGIPKTATLIQIKAAFRKLALLYHPDKNPDTKDLFVKILQAYEVLSDPVLREKYDKGFLNSPLSESKSKINKKERKNKWDVSEDDERKREYYKQYFEKLKKEYEREKQQYEDSLSSYKEWMYWLWAFIICILLFLLIIAVYK